MERTPTNTNEATSAPNKRRDNVFESRLVWLLLLAIAGLWGYYFLLGRVDHKLTSEIIRRLRREFPHHYVSVDRARLIAGQSITVDGLRIAKTTDQGLRDVVRIGRIVCNGPLELVGLAQGQLPIESVTVDSVELCIWPLSSGRWSITEFSSGKPFPTRFPEIQIRSGLVRIGHETGGADREIICHDLRVHASLAPPTGTPGAVQQILVRGSLASSYFAHANVEARLSADKSSWNATGTISKLEYSSRLFHQLPMVVQDSMVQTKGFAGEVDLAFGVSEQNREIQFESQAHLSNGRLLHPMVPYPLDNISGDIFCRKGLLQLRNCNASSGDAAIRLECDMNGFGPGSPLAATATIQNLALDDRLYQALPAALQEHWKRMGIQGTVDASAAIQFDGQKWNPRVLVRARNAGIHADFFPYPVTGLQGDFLYENGRIHAPELTAVAGEQRLSGSLTLQKAEPRWLMDLILAADGPVAIDETLMRALSPRNAPQSGFQKFVHSLHPTGTVLLRRGRFIRSAENPEVISKSLELTFSECSIRYDGFRYPIVDVHGQATLDNDRLVLREFVGRNDSARIRGEGFGLCRDSSLDSIDLIFHANNVALDDELHQALPPSAKNLWEQLQPSGTIDQIYVQIKRNHIHDPLDLRVEMTEVKGTEGISGRGMSLRPLSFPYAINDVECSVIYRPGRIDIRSLAGVHDASRIHTEGQIRLHSDGAWDGQITWLPPSRLLMDPVLQACMPPMLRDPLTRLAFRGPISLNGTTRIASPDAQQQSLVRSWMLNLDLEDASFGGNLVAGIRGSMTINGENTVEGPVAFGSMMIDAMAVKNVAVTGLEGPFVLDRNELLFGRDAASWQLKNNAKVRNPTSVGSLTPDSNVAQASFRSRLRDALPERDPQVAPWLSNPSRASNEVPTLDIKDSDLRARTLSGTLFLSGVEPLNGDRARYRLRLVDADFHGLLVDLGETHTEVSGSLSVQCDLFGSLTHTVSLEGSGNAWLRGANLYELPFMIKLLRALSVQPDQGAFDSADVAFSIDGDQIPIHKLELDGDLVSMRGSGWVNLRRELSLDMYANVGRRSIVGAMMRPITQNRGANLMRIEVSGTTSDPQIRHTMALMNSLEQVLPESP
jgi:hypothetical protein